MADSWNAYLLAADLILLLHFAFVAFVVLGLALIWIGRFVGWEFVRNRAFRLSHLLAMGIVVCESVLRVVCPLTEWENRLRMRGGASRPYETGFVREWVHKMMFFDFDEGTFLIIYLLFFALIAVSFGKIPPLPPRKPPRKQNSHTRR